MVALLVLQPVLGSFFFGGVALLLGGLLYFFNLSDLNICNKNILIFMSILDKNLL